MSARRAIGIVRVSSTRDREDDLASPDTQAQRIREACERDGLDLISCEPELDVSGSTPLAKRPTMRAAVEAVEQGRADVVIAAYFDRLFRSVRVQAEIIERVEAAGGEVRALDAGKVTNGSAGEKLNGTLRGAVAEYLIDTTRERVHEAHVRAVADGRVPHPLQTPGYSLDGNGRAVPNADAPTVARAFAMRAGGATIDQVRAYLHEHGIERTKRGVQSLLASRFVLGELRFGQLQHLAAHEAIVDRETWRRVQAIRQQRRTVGRPAKKERLLSRTGVLRCGTCGRPMSLGSSSPRAQGKATRPSDSARYAFYRCSASSAADCPRRVTIAAEIAERTILRATRAALDGVIGVRAARDNIRAARAALAQAQAELDQAIAGFAAAGLGTEPAAIERLAQLRQARDQCQERVDRIGADGATDDVLVALGHPEDFETLTIAEQRQAVLALFERVDVGPVVKGGRPEDRLEFVHAGGFDWDGIDEHQRRYPLPTVLS